MPAPLPPQPAIDLTGELPALLSAADRAMGRLDGSVLTLPNADLFVFMYVRKEAVLSSQIEGRQSSLQDLLSAEAQLFNEHLPRDVDEVVNYVRAMNHSLARLPDLPVSVRLIREIHAELIKSSHIVTPRTAGSEHSARASMSHGPGQPADRAGSSALPDRKGLTVVVVQTDTPTPKKSRSSVQIGQPNCSAQASTDQSNGSRRPMRARAAGREGS
jgi:Fic family protein